MTVLQVNGRAVPVDVPADTPLLWVLREVINLTGTKYACGAGLCGACTVHVDGRPVRSCMTRIAAVTGKHITTIEGLEGPIATAVKEAWLAFDVPQCGYCQSGQIMVAVALLKQRRDPTDAEIDAAMSPNLCRCGTYQRIRNAIRAAVSRRTE